MVATIDVDLVTVGAGLIPQCMSVSIALGCPQFATLLWSQPMYEGLKVEYGTMVMGVPCAVCVVVMGVSFFFGHVLRARSRFSIRRCNATRLT